MSNELTAFISDGELFPADDLLSLAGVVSGDIDKNLQVRLEAQDLTLNASSLALTGASALITNDKIELVGKWLGLSLALQAQVGDDSVTLIGETQADTNINIIRKITLPNPFGDDIELGKLHIKSPLEVELGIRVSFDSIQVAFRVTFTCLGTHSITFTLNELPQTLVGLTDLIRDRVTQWVLENLAPDNYIPNKGNLLPANPFLTVQGELAGRITPEGEVCIGAKNVRLSASRFPFVITGGGALLTNDLIEVKGFWLGELAVTLSIAVAANSLTTKGQCQLEIGQFTISLPLSNLPRLFGSMLSGLTEALSCSISATIDLTLYNEKFNAAIQLNIHCLGNHEMAFSLDSAPRNLSSLIHTIKTKVIAWVKRTLAPDQFLPWGSLWNNRYFALTGQLHGKMGNRDLTLKASNVGFNLLEGKMSFTSVSAELTLSRLLISGNFQIIDIALIAIKGHANVGLQSNGNLTLSGNLNAGTRLIGLTQSATISASNLGKSTGKLTITGSFSLVNTSLVKIGGSSLSVVLEKRNLSLSGSLKNPKGAIGMSSTASISGTNLLTTGNAAVSTGYTMVSNYLVEISGTTTITAYRNGTISLSGNVSSGSKY